MSARQSLRALRELLFRPETFFRERRVALSLGAAAVVVTVVALALTVGVGTVGWLLTQQVDATRTVTVAEPMPESACESFAEMNASSNASFGTPVECAIDEPRTKQVDVGAEIWDAFVGMLPLVFVGGFVGWLLLGVGLHVASAVADGEGSFGRTLAVAGWGMLPSLLQLVVGLTAAAIVIPGMEFSGDPETLSRQLQGLAGPGPGFGPAATVAGVVATVWQAYVWRGGLIEARDLDRSVATWVAGAVGFVLLLFTVLG